MNTDIHPQGRARRATEGADCSGRSGRQGRAPGRNGTLETHGAVRAAKPGTSKEGVRNPLLSSQFGRTGNAAEAFSRPGLSGNPAEANARFWRRVRVIAGLIVIAAELGFWRYDKVWQYRMPPPYPKRLEHRLRLEEAGYGPLKRARVKYAVLIGGSLNNPKDRIERGVFRQETEKVYLTLRGMGFLPENMYVLQSDTKGDPELSYQVDDVASFESLRMTFDHLRKVVDDNDLLLVYYGTHGGSVWVNEDPSTGRRLRQRISLSYFWLQNQGLLQTTFFDLLLGIRPEVGLLYFGQCRGGGFADELERRVRRQKHLARFVAVALVDQYSNARAGFILALMDAYGSGRVEADRNGDGAISLDEAFTYAKATDWPTREGMNKPFLKGVPDPNLVFLER